MRLDHQQRQCLRRSQFKLAIDRALAPRPALICVKARHAANPGAGSQLYCAPTSVEAD